MAAEWLKYLSEINLRGSIHEDAPLAPHTTFRIGGPADALVEPADAHEVAALLQLANKYSIPYFVLGGGANILVSDAGFRGLVILTASLNEFSIENKMVRCGCGLPISDAAADSAAAGLAGLHHFFSMPGSVGGALWMNARCYGKSIDQLLHSVDYLDPLGKPYHYHPNPKDFSYKRSPFQASDPYTCITAVTFNLTPHYAQRLQAEMESYQHDRAAKGHFVAPCAGSIFKNNRAFGKPSGVIIDSLNLRGHYIGNAQISEIHANILINTGGASAADMRNLISYIYSQVDKRYAIKLEPEILFIGDWSDWPHDLSFKNGNEVAAMPPANYI